MTLGRKFVKMEKTTGNEAFSMKRLLPLFLLFALLCPTFATATPAAPNGTVSARLYDYSSATYGAPQELSVVKLALDGAVVDTQGMPGVIVHGRTLAPLRALAERLDAQVTWLQDTAQVVVERGDDTVVLTMGQATAQVNGVDKPLPDGVPATAIFHDGQGYTMVPLRFFSEVLGCAVTWEQYSYTARLTTALERPLSPEQYLIALDAGHGGSASGAYYENTAEKDLNLAMIQKLDDILRGLGYRTLLTRTDDVYVGLKERSDLANAAQADIFVSIHCNAAEHSPNFQGLYVYHYPGSAAGECLARAIQTPACAFTGAVDRDINSANFLVVRESNMPAVLVETGFMTCHEELERLKNEAYQSRMAQGIAQGIVGYLNAQSQ